MACFVLIEMPMSRAPLYISRIYRFILINSFKLVTKVIWKNYVDKAIKSLKFLIKTKIKTRIESIFLGETQNPTIENRNLEKSHSKMKLRRYREEIKSP